MRDDGRSAIPALLRYSGVNPKECQQFCGDEMINKGYFLITDISGYTSFLTGHELDHAQHIIEALFQSQLEAIQLPLKVSNFQGDAILCYAPGESFRNGAQFSRQVKNIYRKFSDKIAEMQIDPPCACNACANVGDLELKIFVHFGDYLVKSLGGRDELMGADVILAHRMMKNSVAEKTGINSYLLITETAFNNLGGEESGFAFARHSERYDHIGEVGMLVASLDDGSA